MSETALPPEVIAELGTIVGPSHVLTAPGETACYLGGRPNAVVMPGSGAEMAAVLAAANHLSLPVFFHGGGTRLGVEARPVSGGIVIAMSRLNHVLEVDTANLTATVEPGVVLADLQAEVECLGLYFPPDPTSRAVATVGGTAATNASGPRGLKYGATKDFVLGLELALADGTLLHTGARTMKSASGYDLTHLFVGSRGTLGAITRVTVRLLPLPEARALVIAPFRDTAGAARAAQAIIAARLQPSALEVLDTAVLAALNTAVPSPLPTVAGAVLICEVEGSRSAVVHQAAALTSQMRTDTVGDISLMEDPGECEAVWSARRAAYPALARGNPGLAFAKAVVPRNRLPSLLEKVERVMRRHELPSATLAHAGDGIAHPVLLADAESAAVAPRVTACLAEIAATATSLGGRLVDGNGGTDTGAMQVMASLKAAFDPNGILSPGYAPFEDMRRIGNGADRNG